MALVAGNPWKVTDRMYQAIKKYIFIIVFLLVFVLSCVLFMKNNQMVSLNYLVASRDIPLPLLLFIVFSIGALSGIMAWLPKIFTLKKKIFRLERQIKSSTKTSSEPK